MLRPEQMSKVSVTGAKSVMDDVIETMHDLHLVHITDYDGSWEGFEPGDSLEGADETSSQLVTVRAIESILDVSEEDAGSRESVDPESADERLEEIRREVNELDDQRDELRARQRDIEERLDQMELFADLGIDLDLLWGYDSLDVLVGEGDADAVRLALEESDAVEAADVFSGRNSVAAFASMHEGESLDDALVGVPFTAYDVPEETGDPEANVTELEHELQRIETELSRVESELESLKLDSASFLLALEEELTIEAQKYEAPLRFATTARSFIVEGWIPSDTYEEFEATLSDSVGDRVEIAELERARYTDHPGGSHGSGHDEDEAAAAEAEPDTDSDQAKAVADGGEVTANDEKSDKRVATDGGDNVTTVNDDPPVIQKNSKIVNPFEVIVKAVNRPKYSELDPTVTVFLTFPLFFGFMIGDIGYGVVYMIMGWFMYKKFEEGVADVGAVIVWLGLWTVIFGVFYGEIFGLHFLEWFGMHPPLEKGVADTNWGLTWLIFAVIAGWAHLNIGYAFAFVEEYQLHSFKEAMTETGSWLLMLNGLWVFVFSQFWAGSKPDFLVGPPEEMLLNNGPLGFGFTGFPEVVGMAGGIVFLLGFLLLLMGPWYDAFEFVVPLSHVLSYTRLTAVLLAKAGMAVAANLLYFGAYQDADGFHFMHTYEPGYTPEVGDVVFGGLANMGTQVDIGPATLGLEGAILGIPVLIIGHAVVLAVGGTAAIQAIRLEYFEFFEKFYEGGGKNYQPFGHRRQHTTAN